MTVAYTFSFGVIHIHIIISSVIALFVGLTLLFVPRHDVDPSLWIQNMFLNQVLFL